MGSRAFAAVVAACRSEKKTPPPERPLRTFFDPNGYLRFMDGRLVHRVVWESAHGPIPNDWVVHHIDENKLNNALMNLICLPWGMHTAIHHEQWLSGERYTRDELMQKRTAALRVLNEYTQKISKLQDELSCITLGTEEYAKRKNKEMEAGDSK